MKLTILGCYAPYAPKEGACSGYLVQSDNLNIMLDCGHGSFAQLQKHINFRDLDALVVTHFHPDHYADIHAIRHAIAGALRIGTRKDPLVVYLPSIPAYPYNEINEWQDVFSIIPLEEAQLKDNNLGNLILNFFPTVHSLPTFGVIIRKNQTKFTYTSDTAWDNSIVQAASGSKLILAEASLLNADIAYTKKGHLTAKQAGLLGQKAQASGLILTHFWPEYNLNQLRIEAEVGFEGKVELAEMGKSYLIQ